MEATEAFRTKGVKGASFVNSFLFSGPAVGEVSLPYLIEIKGVSGKTGEVLYNFSLTKPFFLSIL